VFGSVFFSLAKDLALYGRLPGQIDSMFLSIFGVAAIVAAITRQEWLHKLLAPAMVLLFLLYIALLFARL